jgi:hypothetical protein
MQDAPMIVGEASTTVRASPNEVFDFVIDLERYRQADHKIGRVGDVRRDGDRGTYPFTLDESRLVFGTPIAGPARWFLASFEGSFDCEATTEGTRVTHREAYRFKAPWRWLAEPLLRSWLERDTADEMVRFKALVDATN